VKTTFLDIDRMGSIHETSFFSKDDAWSIKWGKRSGIPLNNFRDRYLTLSTIPAGNLLSNSFLNRDPDMPQLSDSAEEFQIWKHF
jgi:hypothetical protein